MKTISLPWKEYQEEHSQTYSRGEAHGRQDLRRELGPILDELMHITRKASDTGQWSLPYPGITAHTRSALRILMIRAGLIKDA